MIFRVDPSSGVGLADQIAAQVRQALAGGALSPSEQLPPARQVAAGLDVNMHTVLRAYQALRDEGIIELRRGRGAVVRSDVNLAALSLDVHIRSLASAAAHLGISADDVADAVRQAMTGP